MDRVAAGVAPAPEDDVAPRMAALLDADLDLRRFGEPVADRAGAGSAVPRLDPGRLVLVVDPLGDVDVFDHRTGFGEGRIGNRTAVERGCGHFAERIERG